MGLFLPGQWWIHVSMTEFGGIPLPAAFVLLAGLCAYLSLYPTWPAGCSPASSPAATGAAGCSPSRRSGSGPTGWGLGDDRLPLALVRLHPDRRPPRGSLPCWGAGHHPRPAAHHLRPWLVWQSRKPAWLLLPVALVGGGAGLMQLNWVTRGSRSRWPWCRATSPSPSSGILRP